MGQLPFFAAILMVFNGFLTVGVARNQPIPIAADEGQRQDREESSARRRFTSPAEIVSLRPAFDTQPIVPGLTAMLAQDVERFRIGSDEGISVPQLSNNFNALPEFESGIVISGQNVALKIGGYVKADLITDLDAIDATDSFVTTQILTTGPDRKNVRFHARQSRLSFDTRWLIDQEVARAFVEADFFGDLSGGSSALRLRHAYGRLKRLTVGQTWTTFTDPAAVPQTLDFEGAVSNVNRRQGLIRYEQPVWGDGLSFAAALENPEVRLELPSNIQGEARTQTPDLIGRLRIERDWGEFQAACLLRELAFQPDGREVISGTAWGWNFTGSFLLTRRSKAYYQVTWGEGIGSYRGSPDVVATGANSAAVLPMFGWMVGLKHEWTDQLSSNLTFSELSLEPIPGQEPGNLRETTYLAVNLIANPYDRVFYGVEYLYGVRNDVGGARGDASRLQFSFGFYLP